MGSGRDVNHRTAKGRIERSESEDEFRELSARDDRLNCLFDISRVDDELAIGSFGRREGELLKERLKDRMKAPCADIFSLAVRFGGIACDRLDAIVGELQVDAFGRHQRGILFGERIPRLGEDALELIGFERVKRDADGEAALKLRSE